jgi:hypothetical protein
MRKLGRIHPDEFPFDQFDFHVVERAGLTNAQELGGGETRLFLPIGAETRGGCIHDRFVP